MNSYRSRYGRLLAILLFLLMPVSCGQDPLPEVPAFEKLGFADALEVVHQQVLTAYEQWQEKPRDADLNGRLGMLLSTYGKNAAAEVLYRRAQLLAPSEFRWTYYLAIILSELDREAEAAGMFRAALEIDPGYIQARIQLADSLLQLNQIEESTELYRELTVAVPLRVEGWLGLGKTLDRSGDRAGALTALRRARIAGPQYGEVHYVFAAVLAAGGDEQGAANELAAYQRTIENRIKVSDPLVREVIALNAGDGPDIARANWHLQRGQLQAAIVSYRRALAKNPHNPDAWKDLVNTQAQFGELDQAGATYHDALAAGITYARLHLTYGRALLERQQLDAARGVIGKAIEQDPQFGEALSAMGELEMLSGESAAAVEYFRRSLAARPNDQQVALALAIALNSSDQFEEAANRLEQLSTDPAVDTALALRELAIAYRGMNRKDEAIGALQRSREAARKAYDTPMKEMIDALLAKWQNDGS